MITKLMDGLPNQSMQQGAFDAAVGKYMTDLPAWGAEANALAVDVNAKQVAAAASATSAASQVPLATTQANNAAASATNAAAQASLAAAQANNAEASATSASSSAASSEASRVAASKLNLGGKPAAPTVDNQGAALLTGATYYDTTLGKWRAWNGAAWTDGISAVAGVASINGAAGPLALKTINGGSLLSAGNLVFPTPSEVSIGIKRAPVAGGVLTPPNGYYAFMADAAYTLPDFTGVDTFGLVSLSNSAAVPTTVQTADGWTLTPGLTAGTLKAAAPTSSATPHGTWAGILQTPPILGTSGATAAFSVLGTLQLSSSLVIVLFDDGGNNKSVIAFNPLTGAFGAPVQIATSSSGEGHIYADSATTFVVACQASTTASVRAGSASGLTITLGAPVSATVAYGLLAKLAPGLYVHSSNASFQVEAFSVAGTVVAKGASPGAISFGVDFGTIARVSATTFLFVGPNGSGILFAAVGTVAGTTITFGAAVSTGSPILSKTAATTRFLQAMASGGPFIACMQNASPTTTGNYYGITVAGTVPTVGAVLQVANALGPQVSPRTFISPPATDTSQRILNYSPTQLLVVASGVQVFSISGTTLTTGAAFGSGSPRLVKDALTSANYYVVGATTVDKITVAGTAISSAYQLAAAPVVLASDALNDKSVNYGGTWYAWTLPTMACAITADKWLAIAGGTFNLYRDIA